VSHRADPIEDAIRQLKRLPGVGARSATRLVYWLLRAPEGTLPDLLNALRRLETEVHACVRCGNYASAELCTICADPRRDDATILVVEHPQDVIAMERSGEFRGRYHVLHGAISPMDHVGPADLNIRSLLERLRDPTVREVVLGTDPDVEGDATALYLGRMLQHLPLQVTRLAHGIAVGTEIEYADAISLARAIQHRRPV
jgi:recombination protein RecR